MRKLSREELLHRVEGLAKADEKVKALLKNSGSYDKLSDEQRSLINKRLDIQVKVTTEYYIEEKGIGSEIG